MAITQEMYENIIGFVCSDIGNCETGLYYDVDAGGFIADIEFDGETIRIPAEYDPEDLDDDEDLADLLKGIAIDLYTLGYTSVDVDDSDADEGLFYVTVDADEAYEVNKRFITD